MIHWYWLIPTFALGAIAGAYGAIHFMVSEEEQKRRTRGMQ